MGCGVSGEDAVKTALAIRCCLDFGKGGSYFLMREHHDCLIVLIGLFVPIDRMERPAYFLVEAICCTAIHFTC